MNYWKRAQEIKDDITADRRYIHQNAEVGLETVKTADYIIERLSEMGYEPKRTGGNGVTATVGLSGGKVILLRADMDALPITEESGEPFACTSGAMHACGHDLHAAWLLGAAKLLKENESELAGTVKLMFQPAEETFKGSKAMIADGVLEDPKPDAALAFHVAPGQMPLGLYMYNDKGTMMYSNDGFKITVYGNGSHGAYPHMGVSALNIAVHIYLALQEIIAREVPPEIPAIMTVGKFNSGTVNNAIPETAVIEGTIRTTDSKWRQFIKDRLEDTALKTAEVYRGRAQVEYTSSCPPLVCDPEFTDEVLKYMQELPIPGAKAIGGIQASASEDFAVILEQIPGAFMDISAGFTDREVANSHNPKVVFNEEALPIAAAYLAHVATRWLEEHK